MNTDILEKKKVSTYIVILQHVKDEINHYFIFDANKLSDPVCNPWFYNIQIYLVQVYLHVT